MTIDDTTTNTGPEQKAGTAQEPDQPAYRSLEWWKTRAKVGEWLVAEATAERDVSTARIEAMRRQQIETMIGPRLHNSADFWLYHGGDTTELLDDDGTVNAEKVSAAVAETVSAAPYLAPRAAAPAHMVTSVHGGVDESQSEKTTFGDLLRAASRENRGFTSE